MSGDGEEPGGLLDRQFGDDLDEELVRESALHLMIRRGIENSDEGATVSDDEMARGIRSWSR